ncbi:MAG: hypothetical protein ACREQV_01355 [Candidatus Binatia bacterium]
METTGFISILERRTWRLAARSEIDTSEERAILTVTCLAAFLFFNSFGSISVALPAIQKLFGIAAIIIGLRSAENVLERNAKQTS